MIISASDQKKYPQLTQYVRRAMPGVATVPLIVKNMKKFGSLTTAELSTALKWGQGPKIIVKDLNVHVCATSVGAYGCFRPASPGQIEIAKRFVDDFEANTTKSTDNKNSKGKLVYVLGATILHEMCHRGNEKHGVAEAREMGLAFEKATYGKTIW